MCDTTKAKFRELAPKVIKQASLEANSNSRLRIAMKDITDTGKYYNYSSVGNTLYLYLHVYMYLRGGCYCCPYADGIHVSGGKMQTRQQPCDLFHQGMS